ncbi:MAG: hypothetical protein ACK56I_21835, partial [bacterium]
MRPCSEIEPLPLKFEVNVVAVESPATMSAVVMLLLIGARLARLSDSPSTCSASSASSRRRSRARSSAVSGRDSLRSVGRVARARAARTGRRSPTRLRPSR